ARRAGPAPGATARPRGPRPWTAADREAVSRAAYGAPRPRRSAAWRPARDRPGLARRGGGPRRPGASGRWRAGPAKPRSTRGRGGPTTRPGWVQPPIPAAATRSRRRRTAPAAGRTGGTGWPRGRRRSRGAPADQLADLGHFLGRELLLLQQAADQSDRRPAEHTADEVAEADRLVGFL